MLDILALGVYFGLMCAGVVPFAMNVDNQSNPLGLPDNSRHEGSQPSSPAPVEESSPVKEVQSHASNMVHPPPVIKTSRYPPVDRRPKGGKDDLFFSMFRILADPNVV